VVVVQANEFNVSRIATVIVVALTTHLRLAEAPGNVLIPATISGLPRDSVANVSQLYTLDKSLLTEEIGVAPENVMARIDRGLRLVMAL
jgi:mRNA interferase MazF